MSTSGEFPYRQRVPRIKQDAVTWQADQSEQLQYGPDRDSFKQNHSDLHPSDRLTHARCYKPNRFGYGRIYRRRVIVIYARIDFVIPQMFQRRIGRGVAIRIYSSRLNSAIPNVPINIVREIRRREEQAQTKQDGKD